MGLRTVANEEPGFTLIEVLVVILLMALLATIALPQFLGQGAKARDAEAKTNVRNLMGELEACYVDTRAYDAPDCSPPPSTGLPLGGGPSQVEIVPAGTTANTFEVVSRSRSGNSFTIKKLGSGAIERTCMVAPGGRTGGCNAGVW